jgi:cytidylate kinase
MPLITISRGIGCGGMIIARLVADGLKLELFDDHRLQDEVVRMGVRPVDVEEMDEKAPGFFDLMFSKKPEVYLYYMEAAVYEIAKKGEGVIIGHGSQMLLRDFECALHVHIYAGESTRVKNLMKLKGLSEQAARKLIRKSDHEQQGFFQYAFHMDWTDPSLYDLIINMEQLGIDLPAKLIMEAARSEQIKPCSMTAMDAMDKQSLKKKVQAVLLSKGINLATLFIEVPEKGIVQIHGLTQFEKRKELILNTLNGIEGVSKVEEDISIVTADNE